MYAVAAYVESVVGGRGGSASFGDQTLDYGDHGASLAASNDNSVSPFRHDASHVSSASGTAGCGLAAREAAEPGGQSPWREWRLKTSFEKAVLSSVNAGLGGEVGVGGWWGTACAPCKL